MTEISASPSGRLVANTGGRKMIPIRLTHDEHEQLKQDALSEQRSMSFIANRRYLAGLELEQQAQNQ